MYVYTHARYYGHLHEKFVLLGLTQRRLVISYRRFGRTYRSHLLELEDGTDMLLRNIRNQLSMYVA